MSDMEYNKGKLFPTDLTIKNVVDMILEIKPELSRSNSLDSIHEEIEFFMDYREILNESYEYLNDRIYKVIWELHQETDYYEFQFANTNDDGSISFFTYHYNGGGYYTEVLESALKEIGL